MALLEINNIHVYYGAIHALKGISLKVEEGQIVALIGANGAGKTTTLRTISGLLHPKEGTILYHGEPLHEMKAQSIVKAGISQVPEGRRILHRSPSWKIWNWAPFSAATRTVSGMIWKPSFSLSPV